ACSRRFRAAQRLITCLGTGNVTAQLKQACVLAGASWTFKAAAKALHQLCGAVVSDETLRQLTESAGQEQARCQQQQAGKLLEPPTAQQLRNERELRERERERESEIELDQPDQLTVRTIRNGREERKAQRLLVGLDGGWVPAR